jgi:DedD protein
MAKSISEEELQLRKRARRRLIGAIALVTIVAVFLPMVLDHEPKPVSQDVSIQIPSPNAGTFTSKIVPVVPRTSDTKSRDKPRTELSTKNDATAVPAAGSAADAAPPVYDTEAAPPVKASPQKPMAQAKTVSKPPKNESVPVAAEKPKAPDQTKPETKDSGIFVVQVAALNDADKARQMQEQIAAAGVKSYTEVVPTTKGSVTRVRAGPFASRDEAEKVRDKLKGMGLTGNIAPK